MPTETTGNQKRIDNFIGEIPDLFNLPKTFKSETYNYAYYKGLYDAKIGLRNKLYEKEGISIPQDSDVYTPTENLIIFDEHIMERWNKL